MTALLDDLVPIVYFGRPWNSRRFDPTTYRPVETATPVGEPCLWCDEPIGEGDRGLITPTIDRGHDGSWQPIRRPIHAECELRAGVGGISHLRRQCICYGGSDVHAYRGTQREEAWVVWAMVNAERRQAGWPAM